MRGVFARLLRDDHGDDLIEYALLAVTVAIGGAVALSLFPAVMNTVYTSWDADKKSIWEPLDPE